MSNNNKDYTPPGGNQNHSRDDYHQDNQVNRQDLESYSCEVCHLKGMLNFLS